MDRGAWRAAVHGVTKSWTWLRHWRLHMCCLYLKKKESEESLKAHHSINQVLGRGKAVRGSIQADIHCRGLGFYVGEGNGTPLQCSCLDNPMDGGAWWAAVHGVAKSRTQLRNFTLTFHFHTLEKEMVTHSSVLAWRIPGTGEPGGLPSMGSHRVGHDWSDLAAVAAGFYVSIRAGIFSTRQQSLLLWVECTRIPNM